MVTQNELHDLGFVIKLIRSDINDPNNIMVLDSILLMLKDTSKLIENNQIRKALSLLPQLNEKWEFVKHENYYIRTLIIKNEAVQNELLKGLTELKFLLQSDKFTQAYDLADVLHALPEIISDNNGSIPKSYRKTFTDPYKKKWKT
jgi:phage-related protein